MSIPAFLDSEAVTRACRRRGVARLWVVGSVVAGRFDPERSGVDFLVDFLPRVHDLLGNYLALKTDLERIIGRKVDLVMSDAVENPHFAAEAFGTAEEIYVA
ncbi:nucleotidyltransferase family protein [Aeromicrobium sp. P5_D10]